MRAIIAAIAGLIVFCIAEVIPPSAKDLNLVVASRPANESWRLGGIEATPWVKSGARIYECWWQVDIDGKPSFYQSVHFATNPPAEREKSARRMNWLGAALCQGRLWIFFAGLMAGLAVLIYWPPKKK